MNIIKYIFSVLFFLIMGMEVYGKTVDINNLGPAIICPGANFTVYFRWDDLNGGNETKTFVAQYENPTGTWNTIGSIDISGQQQKQGNSSITAVGPSIGGSFNVRVQLSKGKDAILNSPNDSLTVIPLPSVTLGSFPIGCKNQATYLPYLSKTSNTESWSIVFDATAISAGFQSPQNASLGAAPGNIPIQVGNVSPGTYYGTLTVGSYYPFCVGYSYSITVTITGSIPNTPGAISGSTTACPAGSNLNYSISSVANASGYTWAVPTGWTITSGQGTTSIIVTAGSSGQNGNISVTADNGCGSSDASTLGVTISPISAPVVGAITQPTCAISTGTVALSGLPTTSWTVTASSGATITGNTSTADFSGLAANTTYTFTVNSSGCTSDPSSSATINAKPTTPTPLSLTGSTICASPGGSGTITSSTSENLVSYQLYNSGGTPQGGAQSGAGFGLTWSGLDAGTGYYVIGTDGNSCTSTSSPVDILTWSNPVGTPATISICSGENTLYTPTITPGSTFTWIIGTITGGVTGASDNLTPTTIINQQLSIQNNATTGSVEYIVTPTSTTGSCVGAPFSITVTVEHPAIGSFE